MASSAQRPKLIVIVGPTASGKSNLAMKIAKKYDGEIIAADSRTIYRGMDIGTAKPSQKDTLSVPHWGLDLISPTEKFSAKQFQDYVLEAIRKITMQGKLPILVGGTGLYINSVIFDYQFEVNNERDPINPRHRLKKGQEDRNLIDECLIIGLRPNQATLERRIKKRIKAMVKGGFIKEVKELAKQYPTRPEAFKAPGYEPFMRYIDGQLSSEEAQNIFLQSHLKLAKKQLVWFKRNQFIDWFTSPETAFIALDKKLNT